MSECKASSVTQPGLSRRRLLRQAGGAAAVMAMPWCQAQSFPQRPVRVLVGYSAGGGVDAMARLLDALQY